MHKGNVLIIADTHIPFQVEGYLEFCLKIQKRCKCEKIVHIGDLVDNHAISFYDTDPNGKSPADEMEEADAHLKKWFKAFPKVYICKGNHDMLVDRKARHVGLPERAFKAFRDIWKLPTGWIDDFTHEIDGVIYKHGTGYSGDNAHLKAAYDNRQSTVIGHTHSHGTVGYLANEKDIIFGMNVGSGIDRHKYAFSYGKDFRRKPIISVGVVTDKGRFCQIFPLSLIIES